MCSRMKSEVCGATLAAGVLEDASHCRRIMTRKQTAGSDFRLQAVVECKGFFSKYEKYSLYLQLGYFVQNLWVSLNSVSNVKMAAAPKCLTQCARACVCVCVRERNKERVVWANNDAPTLCSNVALIPLLKDNRKPFGKDPMQTEYELLNSLSFFWPLSLSLRSV